MARDQIDMTPIASRDELVAWFEAGCKPKSAFRIGTEHEKFPFTLDGNRPVPYEGRRGIRALLESAGRRCEEITAADLGFAVAPRLNAAGRLTDMSVGIACLLADDPSEAGRLAGMLAKLNEERREIENDRPPYNPRVSARLSSRNLALTLASFSGPIRSSIFCPAERSCSAGSAYS